MDFPHDLVAAFAALNPVWYLFALVAIFLDLATGFVIKGLLAHNVKSSIMREGLVHKAWEVAIIIAAALIDIALGTGFGIGMQPMSAVTCGFIFLMEVASVCENALEGNPELASAPIIKYVSQAKQEQERLLVKIDHEPDPDDTVPMGRHRG